MTDAPAAPAIDRAAYPFADRWAELPEGRIHYVDQGSGPTLLFVHGTPTWSFEWRHVIRALAPTFRCVAPDLLGFGLSDRPRAFPYTPEAHAQTLARFVDAIGLADFKLIVHDFGGPIALPLALDRPSQVNGIAILNTWMWSLAGDRRIESAARIAAGPIGKLLYRHANLSLRVIMPSAYADRSKLTPTIHRQYLDRFPDAHSRGTVLWPLAKSLIASSAHYEAPWRRREELRNRPALVIWGMRDSAFPPAYLQRWREALPDARVVEIPDAGHWPHEEQPDRVITALSLWLASGSVG